MCNLYNLTSARQGVLDLSRAMRDSSGWNAPSIDIYPNTLAPVVRVGSDGVREIASLTWGMPTPPAFVKGNYDGGVTNVRNVGSPHWRRWLGPESRCVVPITSFAEPNPAAKVEGGRTPNAWFAARDGALMAFAGIWTPWRGTKKVRDGERDFELYAFLTTEPNAVVAPIHQKAMPVLLRTSEEIDVWLSAPCAEAKALQRSLPDDALVIVDPPAKIQDALPL